MPRTPFIDDELDLLLRIVPVHDRRVTRYEFISEQCPLELMMPVRLIELCGRSAVLARATVIVHREALHVPWRHFAHHEVSPIIQVVVRTARYLEELVLTVIAAVGLEPTIQIRIVLCSHIAAATPTLIANAPELDGPRIFPTVLAPQVSHRALSAHCNVLDPLRHFLRGATADVAADVRLALKLFAKIKELVRSKVVVLRHPTPMRVDHRRAIPARPNAVHPMILIGKTTTRPTQVRDLDSLQGFNYVIADSTRVRNA